MHLVYANGYVLDRTLNDRLLVESFKVEKAGTPAVHSHVQDAATGLTYMQARYYDPVIGRFLSPDPVGFSTKRPEALNRYAYGANDPINRRDPNGLDSFFVSRPTQLGVGHHSFILITNVDESGNHTIARRFSFGAKTDSGFGGLVDLTDSGRSVDLVDAAAAEDVVAQLNDPVHVAPRAGVYRSTIDAPDSVVEAVAEAVNPHSDYDIAPGALPGTGVNSNSAPVAIADKATQIAGTKFELPERASVYGANNSDEITFNEEKLKEFCAEGQPTC